MARARETQRRDGNEVEFSRIVAFSDGVFAIAITLLVLNLNVHDLHGKSLGQALWEQRNNLLAYAISFAVIGRFWVVHHRFFGEVTGFDGRLLALNIFYLAWIVLIPFSSAVLGDYGGDEAAVILYAANMAGAVLVGNLMFSDAHRAGLTRSTPEQRHETGRRSWIIAAVFLASIPVALFNPSLAQYVWLGLLIEPLMSGGRA